MKDKLNFILLFCGVKWIKIIMNNKKKLIQHSTKILMYFTGSSRQLGFRGLVFETYTMSWQDKVFEHFGINWFLGSLVI